MNKRQMKKHAKKFLAANYNNPARYIPKLYGVFPLGSGNWEAVLMVGEYPDTWYLAQPFNRRGYCRD